MATTKTTPKKDELSPSDAAALKAFAALARKVKFPGGKGTQDYTKDSDYCSPRCYLAWRKRGGHGGAKTVSNVVSAALAAGFERFDSKRHDIPDGSRIGSTTAYVKLDEAGKVFATLDTGASYGAVAADNYYHLTLKGPELGRKEG